MMGSDACACVSLLLVFFGRGVSGEADRGGWFRVRCLVGGRRCADGEQHEDA